MNNYLIVDTEQTYNVGLIVFNEKGIIVKKQIIVPENFENRAICGINNYNRKKVFFDKDLNSAYMNAGSTMEFIYDLITNYSIKGVFAHNSSTDRIALGNLFQQASAYSRVPNFLEKISILDTIKIVKIIFPENVNTNLNDTINDIMGLNLKQAHTALDDAYWLYGFLNPLHKYLEVFVEFPYLLDNFSDSALQSCLPILADASIKKISNEEIFNRIQEKNYTIRTLNTRLSSLKDIGILNHQEQNKYGVNGQLLKTKLDTYSIKAEALKIINLFLNFKKQNWSSLIKISLSELLLPTLEEQDRNSLVKFKEAIEEKLRKEFVIELENMKKFLKIDFNQKESLLEKEYKRKQEELDMSIKNFFNPALLLFKTLNNKQYKKELKKLEKDYKKFKITEEQYVMAILSLSKK